MIGGDRHGERAGTWIIHSTSWSNKTRNAVKAQPVYRATHLNGAGPPAWAGSQLEFKYLLGGAILSDDQRER